MALINQLFGQNVYVFDGAVLIGCANSITLTGTKKEIDVTCSGSGDTEQSIPGKTKWTFSISAIWRTATAADVATNKTAYDFILAMEAKTEKTITFKDSTVTIGEESYVGVGYITSVKLGGTDNGRENFEVSGFFNTLTPTKATV